MVLCNDDCIPCCDFCIHVKHHIEDGIIYWPEECILHPDSEHQDMAQSGSYCDDFYCYRAREGNKKIRHEF